MEEEYAMQRSWRDDGDKLTFIICQPFNRDNGGHHNPRHNGISSNDVLASTSQTRLKTEIDAMVGDVNLFISTIEDEQSQRDIIVGELELMIASPEHRRKGYGRAALMLFLNYIMRHEDLILDEYMHSRAGIQDREIRSGTSCRIDQFSVKIGATNKKSLALFEGLGFTKTSDSANYFGEFELSLDRERWDELLVNGKKGQKQVLDGYEVKQYRCECAACSNHLDTSTTKTNTRLT